MANEVHHFICVPPGFLQRLNEVLVEGHTSETQEVDLGGAQATAGPANRKVCK